MYEAEDSIDIAAPVETVYRFIEAADCWPYFLPHVLRTTLEYDSFGRQIVSMQTHAENQVVSTTSLRVCTPYTSITFEQTTRPAWLACHSGRWVFARRGTATRLSVEHRVAIDAIHAHAIPVDRDTPAEAEARVGRIVLRNSLATMQAIKTLAERGMTPESVRTNASSLAPH